jgi:DNA-binding MarR family transcriptional regulator
LGVTPPNVTGIIDRLVEQGLVSREENPENRRMLVLTVTGKGRNLLATLRESNMKRMLNVLSGLSEDELSVVAQGLAALAGASRKIQGEAILNKEKSNR